MTQKSIKMFFISSDEVTVNEEQNEILEPIDPLIESTATSIPGVKDLKYYQNLLQKQSFTRTAAHIITSSGVGSVCWKYFGCLSISNIIVLENLKFCKICFEEKTILKG